MNNLRILLLLLATSMLFLQGNGPPPWLACEGKAVGDACDFGLTAACNPMSGVCRLSDSLTDDLRTPTNEQLICTHR